MAINKIFLETDGLVVGATQLVASGGGVSVGKNLSVAGNVYVSDLYFTSGNIVSPNGTPVVVTQGTTESFRINANGNVGIGTSSVFAPLVLQRAGTPNPNFVMQGDGEQGVLLYNSSSTGGGRASIKFANRNNTDFIWNLQTDTLNNGGNDIFLRNQAGIGIYLDANGNVAVAGTSSSVNFYVNGSAGGAINTLVDSATITPNLTLFNNFAVTLAGNRTLANPSNLIPGQSGIIFITQDVVGSRTLAYGGFWKFPSGTAPTLTTSASATDALVYTVRTTTSITAQLINNIG